MRRHIERGPAALARPPRRLLGVSPIGTQLIGQPLSFIADSAFLVHSISIGSADSYAVLKRPIVLARLKLKLTPVLPPFRSAATVSRPRALRPPPPCQRT